MATARASLFANPHETSLLSTRYPPVTATRPSPTAPAVPYSPRTATAAAPITCQRKIGAPWQADRSGGARLAPAAAGDARALALVEIGSDRLHQLLEPAVEEMI